MIMTQLVLNIEDKSILPSLKKILQALEGVSIARSVRSRRNKSMDITKTAAYKEAMEDKAQGRVYHAESVEDMFKQILG